MNPKTVVATASLLTATTLALPPLAQAVATEYLFSWGSLGSADGQFSIPTGIAVAPSGDVFVLDVGNRTIQKFTADGEFLTKWNSYAPGYPPASLIVRSGDGGLFAHEGGYLYKYDSAGNYLYRRPGPSPNTIHVDTDVHGYLYWSYFTGFDACVRVCTQDLVCESGLICRAYLQGGTAVDASRTAYVAGTEDYNRWYIWRRAISGEVSSWEAYASRLAVDANGFVFALDDREHRIRVFDGAGGLAAQFGAPGSGPGQFDRPSDVAFGSSGRIYVVDRNNHRIQVFGPGATPVAPSSWGRMKAAYR